MKPILFLICFLPLFASAEWKQGDGGLDYVCRDKNEQAKPYTHFTFTMYWNSEGSESSFEDIEMAYDISAFQFPFFGAETVAVEKKVDGCQKAPLQWSFDENDGSADIYYECDADGDAGFGEFKEKAIGETDYEITASIKFPEGQNQLGFNQDSKIDLICESAY